MQRLCLATLFVGFLCLPATLDAQNPSPSSLRRSELVAPWARGTFSRHYEGGLIGGGSARGGVAAGPQEGTWGWDFRGKFNKRIWLGWSTGKRSQGGTGAYETDGPRIRRHHHSRSEHAGDDHSDSRH
jgi:hypothetical protein